MGPKDTFFSKKQTINCRGALLDLSTPKVMGVLNVTNDSFYAASRLTHTDAIEVRIAEMVREGVDIIDIGGYSSRPGATDIPEADEWSRIQKALNIVKKRFPNILVSVDTFRASVAALAIKYFNVDFVNDISAGDADKQMFHVVAEHQVAYIAMHMQGTPQNMQQKPSYGHVVKDVLKYFAGKLETLRKMGVKDIVIDPGFGFGKSIDHNYALLRCLADFKVFQVPVLVGVSRKSMIYKQLGITPEESLPGTIAMQTVALQNGADIIRVHDVKEAVQTIQLINKLKDARPT